MSPSAIIFNDVFNSACYCAGPALCIISRICLNKSDLKTGPTSVASDIPGVCSDPGADFRHRHGARSLILDNQARILILNNQARILMLDTRARSLMLNTRARILMLETRARD